MMTTDRPTKFATLAAAPAGIVAATMATFPIAQMSLNTKPEAELKLRILASSRDPAYVREVVACHSMEHLFGHEHLLFKQWFD